MEDTCTCGNCGDDNAYFNGVNYECPDCDFEWDIEGRSLSFNNDFEEEEDELLKELMELDKPFFKLKHGKLYSCKIDSIHNEEIITEDFSIIPLSYKKNKNCLHVLIEGSKWYNEAPKAIEDFSKMDYTTIWNDGITHYFEDSMKMPITILCATTELGALVNQNSFMYDFVEVK